jgi:hypothetical protein
MIQELFGQTLREIVSLGSILQVRAAPFPDLDKMKATINGGFITYVIDASQIYTGHGRGNRNVGNRISQEVRQSSSQVYLISSLDPRFDKHTASYVEARLIDIADRLGIPLANMVRPYGRDGLALSPDLEQLVQHAQILLSVAGFRRFEEARQTPSDRPFRVAPTGGLHDLRVLEPEEAIPSDAALKRLSHRDMQAEGYMVGKRFRVLPGADYCYKSKSGLSTDNLMRRNAIQAMDVLEPLPGVADRARLRVGLDCKSPAIAAKILSGEHIGTRAWQASPGTEAAAERLRMSRRSSHDHERETAPRQ